MPKSKKSITINTNRVKNKRQPPPRGTSGCNLTVDVLIEILSRLPASSLSRFKFVCQSWRSLITADPHFADLHIGRGFVSSSSTCPSVITLSRVHQKYCLMLMDADGGRQHRVFKMEFRCIISSGCNGFICIFSEFGSYLSLFNPTTLQNVVVREMSKETYIYSKYFLGYVLTTREYKIVWFHNLRGLSSPAVQCEVLTLGTSSWRVVDTTICPNDNGGVTINGVMYWIVEKKEIMSFDLKEERFERIQFIRGIANEASWPLCLLYGILQLQGRLCVTVGCTSEPIEVWMLEDPVNHAWIRKYSWRVGCGIPILIIDGICLVKSGDELWYCDVVTGERSTKIIPNERMVVNQAQVHIESLVSMPVACHMSCGTNLEEV